MRETSFIRQNRQKWQEFERFLRGDRQDAEKLNDLFVQVTDDLSYSRTYYPNRMVRLYLNGLAQQAFSLIYRRHQRQKGRFRSFWLEALPMQMWASRRALLLSFVVFMVSMAAGVLSTAMDVQFAEVMLGKDYVEMTRANIEAGNPMAVYKQREQLGMSLGITINNLLVAFITFVTGVFFALGTMIVLIQNGIMVGAFQYFFVEQGLFQESFLTIWIHGTLEISAIILAGAAGLTMGEGLIFPGSYRRLQAFQQSARRGLKIMLGITPVFILAGFIEGYVTRFTEMPDWVRLLFIVSCLLFVLIYFVWYPWMLARRGFVKPVKESPLPPERMFRVDLGAIRTNGEIFSDTYAMARQYARAMLTGSVAASVLYMVLFVLKAKRPLPELLVFPEGMFSALASVSQFFYRAPVPSWIYMLIIMMTAMKVVYRATHQERRFGLMEILILTPFAYIIITMLGLSTNPKDLFIVMLVPFALLFMKIFLVKSGSFDEIISRLRLLVANQLIRVWGLSFLMLLVSMLFYTLSDTVILKLQLAVFSWLVYLSEEDMATFSVILLSLVHLVLLGFFLMLYLMGISLLYYTLVEISDATVLKENAGKIGRAQTIRGLEKE
jgi:uncharacterized membrane protein SpoIIM required for sporulation